MSVDAESPDEPADPADLAREATDEALQSLDAAANIDSVAEKAKMEQEAATNFAELLAGAMVEGLAKAHVRSACGQIADAADYYTKSDLADLIETEYDQQKNEADSRRPFDGVIRSDLDEVVIVRTTDAKQSTLYRWQFNGASVETRASAEGRTHFHWSEFRDEYFDALGEDPAAPTKDLRGGEEWREFIVDIVDDRGREVTTRGPRSNAVDGLQNFVRRSIAYGDIEDMVERDGVYLDAHPDEDPDELWVPNADIKRICDEHELGSVRELQIELDARGYTVDRVTGVSESTFVNNNKVTYWVLSADLADPLEYEDDVQDPAEQVRQEEQDDEDGDDEDVEPGTMGAVGPDPDEEDVTDE